MSYDWKKILLNPEQPIRDALELIDRESLRIALVVDENLHLLGVVTDGDVRRGLLRNLTLASPVKEVMNATPLTAKLGTARQRFSQVYAAGAATCYSIIRGGSCCWVRNFAASRYFF